MVLAVSEIATHQKSKPWRWVIGLGIASLVFGGVAWLCTGDIAVACYSFGLPWMLAAFCFMASLIWFVTLIPLMLLVAWLAGKRPGEIQQGSRQK